MNSTFPVRDHKGDLIWPVGKINRRRPSEGELAERLAERHRDELRYWPKQKKWIVWTGEERVRDTQNLAMHLAHKLCREAAEAYGDHTLDSHRSVAGVLALSKSDPRLVVDGYPCHPELEAAVDDLVRDYYVIDPEAWTPRVQVLKTTTALERFDVDELSRALEARGIVYRRKGNVHGYEGIRLRETADE